MREMALWISGAALAFFVTAGAFLLLANLATVPSEQSLKPDPSSRRSGPNLELNLDEDRLAALEALPAQSLDVMVRNRGDEALSGIDLTLHVFSESTSLLESHFYRRRVERLPAGGTANVHFELDLSAPETKASRPLAAAVPEPPRKVLEIRASTPDGVPAVRTAILPLSTTDT